MPDNNKQYYIYVPGEAKGRVVDADTFEAKKDKLYSAYPNANVSEISNYDPNDTDFRDGDQYQIMMDGLLSPMTVDSKSFNAKKDDFFRDNPDAQVKRVRDYTQDYWQPKLDEAQAALDSFDKENGEFMLKYEEDLRSEDLKQRGWGGDLNDVQRNVTENREKYFGLAKQRKALLEAKYDNPLIARTRLGAAEDASSKREEYLDIASRTEDGGERRAWKRAAKLQGDAAELFSAPSEYGKTEKSGFEQYLDDYKNGAINTFSDRDFWTRGITQISRDFDLRGIRKKVIEAEKAKGRELEESDYDRILTAGEKAELMAFYNLAYAQADKTIGRAEDLSSAYRAGSSAADSVGFMAEFMLGTGFCR